MKRKILITVFALLLVILVFFNVHHRTKGISLLNMILYVQSFNSPTALTKSDAIKFTQNHGMTFDEAYNIAYQYAESIEGTRYHMVPWGFVVDNEFFFPKYQSKIQPISSDGYYVNPVTKQVRRGSKDCTQYVILPYGEVRNNIAEPQ